MEADACMQLLSSCLCTGLTWIMSIESRPEVFKDTRGSHISSYHQLFRPSAIFSFLVILENTKSKPF